MDWRQERTGRLYFPIANRREKRSVPAFKGRTTPYLVAILLSLSLYAFNGWAKARPGDDARRAGDDPLTDDEVVVKTEGAHHLLLPKDWPVVQKDGQLAPVPIEEYLSMKFGQVREKFDGTSQRIAALGQRFVELEQGQQAILKRLQLLEERVQAQEVTHGNEAKNP